MQTTASQLEGYLASNYQQLRRYASWRIVGRHFLSFVTYEGNKKDIPTKDIQQADLDDWISNVMAQAWRKVSSRNQSADFVRFLAMGRTPEIALRSIWRGAIRDCVPRYRSNFGGSSQDKRSASAQRMQSESSADMVVDDSAEVLALINRLPEELKPFALQFAWHYVTGDVQQKRREIAKNLGVSIRTIDSRRAELRQFLNR